MDTNYREYLDRQLKEAQEQFEKAKKDTIKAIEDITFFNAADYGATYYTKIDEITKAGQKVQTIAESIRAYDYFEQKGAW